MPTYHAHTAPPPLITSLDVDVKVTGQNNHPPANEVFARKEGAAFGAGLHLDHRYITRGHAFHLDAIQRTFTQQLEELKGSTTEITQV